MSFTPPPALLTSLRQAGLIDASDEFSVLRGGRTNQVWRMTGDRGDRVLKLFPDEVGNPLFPNHPHQEIACLRNLAGTGIAPEYIDAGLAGGRAWVIYAYAKGQLWTSDTLSVARVLNVLHRHPVPMHVRSVADGSQALTHHTHAILALCSSNERRAIARLAPKGTVPPSGAQCFLHGDPVPGNILIEDGRAVLIDWQCPARGDPCEDLAIFTSPAMQHLYRGAALSAGEIAAFLDRYPDANRVRRFRALQPWYHWRMAAYCLWQIERGNLDYAPGLAMESECLSVCASLS